MRQQSARELKIACHRRSLHRRNQQLNFRRSGVFPHTPVVVWVLLQARGALPFRLLGLRDKAPAPRKREPTKRRRWPTEATHR